MGHQVGSSWLTCASCKLSMLLFQFFLYGRARNERVKFPYISFFSFSEQRMPRILHHLLWARNVSHDTSVLRSQNTEEETVHSALTLQRKSHLFIPFLGMRGLSPNFHIHVSVSDLYSSRISLHISSSRIAKPVMGIYKSLTYAWMWKLGLRPQYSFSGNICFEISVFRLCSVEHVEKVTGCILLYSYPSRRALSAERTISFSTCLEHRMSLIFSPKALYVQNAPYPSPIPSSLQDCTVYNSVII